MSTPAPRLGELGYEPNLRLWKYKLNLKALPKISSGIATQGSQTKFLYLCNHSDLWQMFHVTFPFGMVLYFYE